MNEATVLTAAEERLADIIWQNAPLTSPELVALTNKKLDWKKSTTYTVLRKLCDKGIFKNENAVVTALLTRDELIARQSRQFVAETFGGSLPGFIASFVGGQKLSSNEAEELKQLIESYREEE